MILCGWNKQNVGEGELRERGIVEGLFQVHILSSKYFFLLNSFNLLKTIPTLPNPPYLSLGLIIILKKERKAQGER